MIQKSSFINTTSFINSSNESLNKLPLSSSQSTVSSDYVSVTSDSIIQGNQPANQVNTMLLNHPNSQIQSSLITVQPTVTSPQNSIYGVSTVIKNSINLTNQQPIYQPKSVEMSNGSCHMLYESANQTLQNSSLVNNSRLNNITGTDTYLAQSIQTPPLSNCNNNNINDNKLPSNYSNQTRDELSTVSTLADSCTNTLNKLNNNQKTNEILTLKSNPSVKSFHHKKSVANQRSSISSVDSSNSNTLMPLNVKSMLLHGVTGCEVVRNWLKSIKCEEYVSNFLDNGYDMPLLARMTPQDLSAIGCRSPDTRKKLLMEIRKLNLEDDIPNVRPYNLEQWLELLKLKEYYDRLCIEGYDNIDKVCELTWEDLEDIGITKLGHQKRLLLGIERLQKCNKRLQEQQNDHAIYDVHPNHRISLNQSDRRLSTMSRSTVRSGLFQTRPGANLDHRGLPMASVTPAFKYVNNSLANLDISKQVIETQDSAKLNLNLNNNGNNRLSTKDSDFGFSYNARCQSNGLESNEPSIATTRKNPPPLPPVRSNSLKIGTQEITSKQMNGIYGNDSCLQQQNDSTGFAVHASSNSFLRTPRLGNLTATTNKMLIQGGHIQAVNGQPILLRSIVPVREAPLPPLPSQPPPIIREKIEEESSAPIQSFTNSVNITDSSMMNSGTSLISHQLASADEFPPPPPSQ